MLAYTFYEADNRVRRYAKAFIDRGDKVDAIALARDDQPSQGFLHGVRILRIQKRKIDERGPLSYLFRLLMFFFRSAWVLTREHLREPYNIIHVHSVPDFEIFATLIPRLLGARVILDIHDLVPEFYVAKFGISDRSLIFRLLVFVERISIAYSHHVIISNHLWYEKLVKRSVKREKCTPIINYPDREIFYQRPRPACTGDELVMCYPGTLNSHQGLDLAVKAVALLRDEVPNLHFLMIGDGPDREKLKAMIEDLKLKDRVSLNGFMPLEGVAEVLARVDLGVVPKRRNSFGNEAFSTKIMEFMAMNVPALVSRTRIDEYYFNESLVEFFESENVEDLAAKIVGLIKNPARRAQLGRNGAEYISRNNWGAKKEEYLILADSLCERKAGTSASPAKIEIHTENDVR